ncbi:hypothetical protein SDC9_126252 [bioreactor metagenome]|uniref:Uncharacterized protein n=1 Tax=bioreactor metagenome TaxID=1076179 RepID=A0A645CQP3_9ZZZZ
MPIYRRRETNFFEFHYLLVLALFLVALDQLEPVLAVVHDLAYGRFAIGRNEHKVEFFVLRERERLRRGVYAELFPVASNKTHFLCVDLIVDHQIDIANIHTPPIKIKAGRNCPPKLLLSADCRSRTIPGRRETGAFLLLTR